MSFVGVMEDLVASRALLDVSEWLEVELMGKGVEPWSSQKIQQIGSRGHLGERKLSVWMVRRILGSCGMRGAVSELTCPLNYGSCSSSVPQTGTCSELSCFCSVVVH